MSRRSRPARQSAAANRRVDYKHLRNTLIKQPAFSDDRVEAIHETALRVVEELGIRVINDEARSVFKSAGAEVDESTQMVNIDRELVEQALQTAPSEFILHGARSESNVTLGGDNIAFVSVGGPPHISDLDRGKRNGTLQDTRNIIKLSQHFDVIHIQSPNVEPQDVALNLRHLHTTESQLSLSHKPFFIF